MIEPLPEDLLAPTVIPDKINEIIAVLNSVLLPIRGEIVGDDGQVRFASIHPPIGWEATVEFTPKQGDHP